MIEGSMRYKCERICRTYVETGRTMRQLAYQYSCDIHTLYRYLNDYARDYVDYDLYRQVRERAKQNLKERNMFGRCFGSDSDQLGSMD